VVLVVNKGAVGLCEVWECEVMGGDRSALTSQLALELCLLVVKRRDAFCYQSSLGEYQSGPLSVLLTQKQKLKVRSSRLAMQMADRDMKEKVERSVATAGCNGVLVNESGCEQCCDKFLWSRQ
jgi:hypothetical protein